MSFGTIAIWTESGDYQEFTIEKQTTSIGRLPGNDIVLNTNAVSRYHAQIEVADGQVYLIDKETVNGTYLNDVIVEPETRVPLDKDSRIVMGDVRMIFIPPEAATRTQILLLPEVLTISEEGIPFTLVLDKPHQKVAPGARLNLSLLIKNTGAAEDSFIISTSGMDDDWVRLNWQELTLGPDQEAEVQISIRPPRSSNTHPGLYPLTVTVHLEDQPELKLQGERAIEVADYGGFAMDARQSKPDEYRVSVQNQGNIPLGLSFNGFSRRNVLAFKFDPPQFELAPGEARTLSANVKLRRGASKPEKPIRFAILAQSTDAAHYTAPLSLRYEHKPNAVPFWVGAPILLMVAGIGAVILAVAFLFFFVLSPNGDDAVADAFPTADIYIEEAEVLDAQAATPTLAAEEPEAQGVPEAEITRFEADPPSIIYRTEQDILLQWDVENHVDLRLYGPDEAEIELSEQQISTRQLVIQTEDLMPGSMFFFLEATGADDLTVQMPVEINILTAECEIQGGANAPLYDRPNLIGAEQIDELQPETLVIITGRTSDTNWLRISVDAGPLGWVSTQSVICAPGSVQFDQYIVTTPQPPN